MPGARLGVVVSKKGNRLAVRRNRIKRIMREQFRVTRPELPAVDIVIQVFAQIEDQELRRMLENLFRHTPPTALLVDTSGLFAATHQFLAQSKLRAPQDVSIISGDPDPAFEWSSPAISHIHWDPNPVIRNVLRWVGHLVQGKPDLKQRVTAAEFFEGGTIGPARS